MSTSDFNRDSMSNNSPLAERVSHQVFGAKKALQQEPLNLDAAEAESRALRIVFRDLGKRYTAYRQNSGVKPSRAIRVAVRKFRAGPSLAALIPVAGVLDELALLDW